MKNHILLGNFYPLLYRIFIKMFVLDYFWSHYCPKVCGHGTDTAIKSGRLNLFNGTKPPLLKWCNHSSVFHMWIQFLTLIYNATIIDYNEITIKTLSTSSFFFQQLTIMYYIYKLFIQSWMIWNISHLCGVLFVVDIKYDIF